MRENNPATVEQWYREHALSVRNFLRFCTRNQEIAEDLTQDTFLQVWQKPKGFDSKKSTIRAYLLGIARNKAADWWRSKASQQITMSETTTTGHEFSVLFGDSLAALAPYLRTILWLREVEGYSYSEIARLLEIPIGTVRSRLFSAREQLRLIWDSKREKKNDL